MTRIQFLPGVMLAKSLFRQGPRRLATFRASGWVVARGSHHALRRLPVPLCYQAPSPLRYSTGAPSEGQQGSEGGSSGAGKTHFVRNALAATLVLGAACLAYDYYNGTLRGPASIDYRKVAQCIGELMDDLDYDDGSYGPIFVRIAWHSSGTYDKNANNGGSNGGTIRLEPESKHGANAGLQIARARLEEVKRKFPGLSYADLFTLAGVVAIKEMGGPAIPWRPGRIDKKPEDKPCPPEGRLPSGKEDGDGLRKVFYKMGFNDQEIVALSGAHAMGRCHRDRSGYEGPWSFSPTTFSNEYFRLLLEEKWVNKKWDGPDQYVDAKTGSLMMLFSDMALIQDRAMRPWVEAYAKDESLFFDHFAKAFSTLLELGWHFSPETKAMTF